MAIGGAGAVLAAAFLDARISRLHVVDPRAVAVVASGADESVVQLALEGVEGAAAAGKGG